MWDAVAATLAPISCPAIRRDDGGLSRRTGWSLEWSLVLMPPAPPDWSRQPDDRLAAACASGDHLAWRELVRRYGRVVYGIPRAIGLQPADADDVFQHTFVEFLRYLPRLRDTGRIEAWLVTTAHRRSVRLRQEERRRRRLVDGVEAPPPEDPPDVALDRLIQGERLCRALESLGEPCRTLLLGLFAEPARPYRDLARQLGLAVGTLGSMRARCLDRLSRQFRRWRSSRDESAALARAADGRAHRSGSARVEDQA
jgi:RNA polymerase sigma factor (sigma-70 family)